MKKKYSVPVLFRVPVTIMVESFIEIEAENEADFEKQISHLNDEMIDTHADYEIVDTNEEIDSMVEHNIGDAQGLSLRYDLEDTVGDMEEYEL